MTAVEGWDGRREIKRWIRHQLTMGGTEAGWAWLLMPFKLPGGAYVSTTPVEVEA